MEGIFIDKALFLVIFLNRHGISKINIKECNEISFMWDLEKISVESYSGYKLHEIPRAFTFGGKRYIVEEVIDRWYEGGLESDAPIINYFRVLADDGKEYLIRYDTYHDEWTMVIRRQRPGLKPD